MSGGWLLAVIAFGYAAGAAGWLRNARSARVRARGLERQGRPADQWRTLAAKDGVGALLFVGLAIVSAAEATENRLSAAGIFLAMGTGPMALSLRLGRRFERLSLQVAATEDLAQRSAEVVVERSALSHRLAERLAGRDVPVVPGIEVRTIYQPVHGSVGGDFVGIVTVEGRLDLVVGDVAGHGFDAALEAMRLKDLLLAELRVGRSPAMALEAANLLLHDEARAESLASAFVAQYEEGTVRYASAGHHPALIVGPRCEQSLGATGPLLGAIEHPAFAELPAVLIPGESLVVFTDGLVEAYGPAGGIDAGKIADILRCHGVEGLHARVCEARHEPVRDDIALLEIRRLAVRQPVAPAQHSLR